MVEGALGGEGGGSKTALMDNNEAAATGCQRPTEVSSLALLGIPPRGVAGHAAKGGGGTSNAAYAGAGGARGRGSCDAGAARAAGVDGGGARPDCGPASGGR